MGKSIKNKPADQLPVYRHAENPLGRQHLQESKYKPNALEERFGVLSTQFVDLQNAIVPFVRSHGFTKLIGKRDILRSAANNLAYMFDERFQPTSSKLNLQSRHCRRRYGECWWP